MNKGSKVICINDRIPDPLGLIPNKPVKDSVYTVREFFKTRNGDAVHLEEITNPLCEHPSGLGNIEPSFAARRFAIVTEDDVLKLEEIKLMEV